MKKLLLAAIAAIAVSTTAQAQDGPYPFTCEEDIGRTSYQAGFNQELERLGRGVDTARSVIFHLIERWDASWMMEQCANGGVGGDFGCMHDRRDWAAIEASIPANLFTMSDVQRREMISELARSGPSRIQATIFCNRNGVRNSLRNH